MRSLGVIGCAALLLGLAGCVVGTATDAATPLATTPGSGIDGAGGTPGTSEHPAVLTVYTDGVRSGADPARLRVAHSGTRIPADGVLRADATGLAELPLPSGALLRVGPAADLHLAFDARGGDDSPTVIGVRGGHSWHRTTAEAQASAYRVNLPGGAIVVSGDGTSAAPAATPGATGATDTTRGAVFSVACDSSDRCDIVVIDGVIIVTPTGAPAVRVAAFQRLVLQPGTEAASADPMVQTYAADGMRQDPWLGLNLALDGAAGHRSAATDAATARSAASLAGTWSIATTVAASDDPTTPVGTVSHRDWSFETATCDEVECVLVLTRSFGSIGKTATQTATETLRYTDDALRAHHVGRSDCVNTTGAVLARNYFAQANTYVLHVVTAELRDGMPTATRLEGTSTSTTTFASPAYTPGCFLNAITPTTQTVVGVLTHAADHAVVTPPVAQPVVATDAGGSGSEEAEHAFSPHGLADGAHARSVLSALPTVQSTDLSLVHLATTATLTLILMLIVGYPAQLLNSTISSNYDRIVGWTIPARRRVAPLAARVVASTRRLRGTRRPGAATGRLGSVVKRAKVPTRWVGVAVGVATASVIAGFVDPTFSINTGSVRMLASLAASFIVDSLCSWLLVIAVIRRLGHDVKPTVRFRFASLFIVAGAVLFSRLTGFEPGMVFGAVFGLSLGVVLAKTHKGRVTLLGVGYSAVISIAAWIVFSILTPAFGSDPSVVGVFTLETLSSFAIGGFASLPLTLLPVDVFDGGALFAWRRAAWALTYALGVFAFLFVLLPLPSSWGTVHTPLAAWLGLYVAFGVFAVLVWAYFRLVPSRPDRGVPPSAAGRRAVLTPAPDSDDAERSTRP